MEIKTINITCNQYLIIQALFNAVSDELSRVALGYVWYDINKDLFVATDGHVFRQEKIEWVANNKPEFSFLIHRHDMMLTKKQLREKYGSMFLHKMMPFEYRSERFRDNIEDEKNRITYPNIWNVIPSDLSKTYPLETIGINLTYLEKFSKSFYGLPDNKKNFIMQFSGAYNPQLSLILLFRKEDKNPRIFVGGIMPMRFDKYLE